MKIPCDVHGCDAMIESENDELHVCGRCTGTGVAMTQARARNAKLLRGKKLKSKQEWMERERMPHAAKGKGK